MKILHLSKFYPPDSGGLEHVVAGLAEGAAARGHEVRVVAAASSPRTRAGQSLQGGVTVLRVAALGHLWSQPLAPAYLTAARWPADVVYLHRPHPLADLATVLAPRRPTIILHHSDVQRQRAVRWAYGPLARWNADRAAAVIVASQAHLNHARDLGSAGRGRARVIRFGVDATRFVPRPDAIRPEGFPAPERGPVGLFVGRLVTYKGLEVLLQAAYQSRLPLVIVGTGPLLAPLKRRIAGLGLGDHVMLAGAVAADALPGYYQAADYVVLPSITAAEMFGVTLLEAMACGKPVITTALPTGVREVNQDGVTGLEVQPGDANALRAAMDQLASDPALRVRLGAAGRARVEEHFNLDRMIEAHLALCEEVIRAAAARSAGGP